MRKIHGKYPEFLRSRIGQRNRDGIGVYDFAYVRCNRTQDVPQIEARRDSGRLIEEQLKSLVLTLKFRFCAHGLLLKRHLGTKSATQMMIDFVRESQALPVLAGPTASETSWQVAFY